MEEAEDDLHDDEDVEEEKEVEEEEAAASVYHFVKSPPAQPGTLVRIFPASSSWDAKPQATFLLKANVVWTVSILIGDISELFISEIPVAYRFVQLEYSSHFQTLITQ